MASAIDLKNITKLYADQAALDGLTATVEPGAFCVLLGPSGCGKSTLLRVVAGLEAPTAGEVRLAGRTVADPQRGINIAPGARDLGMVFQSYALWPHKTVRDNITWPLKVAGHAAAQRGTRLAEIAAMLDITPYLSRYPAELSGGQQQRVAMARSIAPRPSLLLFDEPLSNLDAQLRVEMRTELLNLHRQTGATIVYVTHDQVEAMTMATQIIVMNAGRIEQDGTTHDVLHQPQTAFVAGFVGNPPANVFTVHRNGEGWTLDDQRLNLDLAIPSADAVKLMVRPPHLKIVDEAGAGRVPARFVESLPFGTQHFVQMKNQTGRITALVDDWAPRAYGAPVFVELPAQPDAVFAIDGARIA